MPLGGGAGRKLTWLERSNKLQGTMALLFSVVFERDWMITYKCWPDWIISQ